MILRDSKFGMFSYLRADNITQAGPVFSAVFVGVDLVDGFDYPWDEIFTHLGEYVWFTFFHSHQTVANPSLETYETIFLRLFQHTELEHTPKRNLYQQAKKKGFLS